MDVEAVAEAGGELCLDSDRLRGQLPRRAWETIETI